MAMRKRSGTPAMCMAMTPPEWREFDPTSSRANPSLAVPHSFALHPDDRDDVRYADRVETLSGRVISDCGDRVASMFLQTEGDVDTYSNWAG